MIDAIKRISEDELVELYLKYKDKLVIEVEREAVLKLLRDGDASDINYIIKGLVQSSEDLNDFLGVIRDL